MKAVTTMRPPLLSVTSPMLWGTNPPVETVLKARQSDSKTEVPLASNNAIMITVRMM